MRLRSTAFLPEVRRRDSSENRVQERIVAAVNGRVPEDE